MFVDYQIAPDETMTSLPTIARMLWLAFPHTSVMRAMPPRYRIFFRDTPALVPLWKYLITA